MALIWVVCVVSGCVISCAGSPLLVYCMGVLVSVVFISVVHVWFCLCVCMSFESGCAQFLECVC